MRNFFTLLSAFVMAFACQPLALFACGPGCGCGLHADTIAPPHGGLVERTNNHLVIEVVSARQAVLVYVLGHGLQTLPVNEVTVTGSIELPKRFGGKQSELSFHVGKINHQAIISLPPEANHYTLLLAITYQGKTENVKFTIEN